MLAETPENTYNILVVCTGNICRSPMGEGMLKAYLPPRLADRVQVSSAGTHALHGNPAQPHAVEAMRRRGIDIRSHRARPLSRALIKSSNLVLVMERFHLKFIRMKALFNPSGAQLLTAYDGKGEHSEVPDPMGEPLETYEESAVIIHNCVEGVCKHLDTII